MKIFYDHYFPESMGLGKVNKFLALRQKHDMTILKYTNKFNELAISAPQLMESGRSKAKKSAANAVKRGSLAKVGG